jgi:hypothetical protein
VALRQKRKDELFAKMCWNNGLPIRKLRFSSYFTLYGEKSTKSIKNILEEEKKQLLIGEDFLNHEMNPTRPMYQEKRTNLTT